MSLLPQTGNLLFELYSEEIPASYQKRIIEESDKILRDAMQEKNIEYDDIKVMGTPRRYSVLIRNLRTFQKKKEEIIKGPPKTICFDANGKATPALAGFAAKVGSSVESISFSPEGYAVAKMETGGKESISILGDIITDLLLKFRFPRTMHWGNYDVTYARPVYSWYGIFAGKEIDPSAWSQHDFWKIIEKSKAIRGHFILDAENISLSDAGDYEAALEKRGIIVDPQKRKSIIREKVSSAAQSQGLNAVLDEDLLDEVNFIVEKPDTVMGSFPEEFLSLPDIVIITEMQKHQKYFPARSQKDGKLSHHFFIVTNGDPVAGAKYIAAGNERVLKARLSDGRFFYESDKGIPLAEHARKLQSVVFMEGMGSVHEKKERVKEVALRLRTASALPALEKIPEEKIRRAADLVKADLVTKMVFEFEHLQGEMGKIYALHSGEEADVAEAIYEHYLPRFSGDEFPQSPLGIIMSLAEKMDNIITGFLAGKEPKSSGDPLGLRRASLYFIEILLANKIFLDIPSFLESISGIYKNPDMASIWGFFRNRAVTIYEKEGFAMPYIRAALSAKENKDLHRQYIKLRAIQSLQNNADFEALMAAFTRMANIVTKSKIAPSKKVNPDLFRQNEEKTLHAFYLELEHRISASREFLMEENYRDLFTFISGKKGIVDGFFDHIMVMDEDISVATNRLALLQSIIEAIAHILNLNELK